MRVLIVEDEPNLGRQLRSTLEGAGYASGLTEEGFMEGAGRGIAEALLSFIAKRNLPRRVELLALPSFLTTEHAIALLRRPVPALVAAAELGLPAARPRRTVDAPGGGPHPPADPSVPVARGVFCCPPERPSKPCRRTSR